jgi:ectoine hydroxylase-related dioxygenase (phytanoyl-CoA dioxygenase family)
MPEFLDDYFLLSNYMANIAGPGSKPMYPHTDTADIPADFMLGLNLVWFVDDVTAANGGTRLLPGSHRTDVGLENIFSNEEMIAAEGPAGSAFFFDQRLWHGTGANITTGYRPIIITQFIRYWIRSVDNGTLSISDEVYATLPDRIKTMLGFRVTSIRGTTEGQPADKEGVLVTRNFAKVGELYPSRRS